MARGLVSGELSGLTELLRTLQNMPEIAKEAIEAGSNAAMQEGVKDLQNKYLSVGGQATDYIYKSIGSYGTSEPTGKQEGTDYWFSVGVFHLEDVYNEQNEKKQATQKSQIKRNVPTAPQLAYWIENGTSRLKSGARKPKNAPDAAFNPSDLITAAPQPFISEAFVTGWDGQFSAFSVAFNIKIGELT